MSRLTQLLILLLIIPICAEAQNLPAPVNIVVNATADDPVGRSLAYEFKERVNTSSQMRLAEIDNVSSGIKVNLVTLDPDEDERMSGVQTVYSIVWTYFTIEDKGYMDIYLTQNVGVVGSDRVGAQARTLVARTNEKVDLAEEEIGNTVRAIMEMGAEPRENK